MHEFDQLLEKCRNDALDTRGQGTAFENISQGFLQNDATQQAYLDEVQTYKEWAHSRDEVATDAGIDLVAKLRDKPGFAAIQCKFLSPETSIKKGHLDSFLANSGRDPFEQRIFIDTTEAGWSTNASKQAKDQKIPVNCINLQDFRNSDINWGEYLATGAIKALPKKKLRPDQFEVVEETRKELELADRGKIIMACGTGKTFTSLKIAEDLVGKGGRVLYMVPSLALMSQTIREWTSDSTTPLRAFSVCSDSQVGKRGGSSADKLDLDVMDLALPATTDARKLAEGAGSTANDKLTVIFATYQSIDTLTKAQQDHRLPDFDLIICDEAHRTTGAKLSDADESHFTKIHSNANVGGKKRLYMTATPRLYGERAKKQAEQQAVTLSSMDDESIFGKTIIHRGFAWAVENNLLSDYKVVVLAVDEGMVSASVQKRLADEANELQLDDATKVLGCYKALTKQELKLGNLSAAPMKRALAFCRSIAMSKTITAEFANVVEEFRSHELTKDEAPALSCKVEHVDGTFRAKERNAKLEWLKADSGENNCRILTNARCLSEGVDVPALDAIMFLNARNSLIDVVQSVGRVMRKAEGKDMGYVILPVVIEPNVDSSAALDKNERYRVVWQTLNALRSHDERLDADINKLALGEDAGRIQVVGMTSQMEATTAVVENLPSRSNIKHHGKIGAGGDSAEERSDNPNQKHKQFELLVDELSRGIKAAIVKKCGTADYWDEWGEDVAKIAQAHITRLTSILDKGDKHGAQTAFDGFLGELKKDLNDGVSRSDAIEMLAQHMVTKPVFDVLFSDQQFSSKNPVSLALEKVLTALKSENLQKEATELAGFYAAIQRKATGITKPEARQELIRTLYDNFFRKAFPRVTAKLGIVYTPVEVVDFIIHSINDVLKREFDLNLGSSGVHIIDPFTGTGTFITRLLQSGLIEPDKLRHKYTHEIHANEIVLLAYYIAAINIETTYNALQEDIADRDTDNSAKADAAVYQQFDGICLTDTFQMHEDGDLDSRLLRDNSKRLKRQKALDIRVIMGNPPYSSGQKSENDNAQNVKYPTLDTAIEQTYAANSQAALKKNLYDSYIRAIKWGSQRMGLDGGIMGFVTNAGWIDSASADGMRKCLAEEFTNLYIFHLRGDQRTNGEISRQEGGKIFGGGSRTPAAISLFVKNPAANSHGNIRYHDIGNYLDRLQKLAIIGNFKSIDGIARAGKWQKITPDKHNDWLDQRDDSFEQFLKIGDRKHKGSKGESATDPIFANYSQGILTSRDAWCYNSSRTKTTANIARMISAYNRERAKYHAAKTVDLSIILDDFISNDPTKVSWSVNLKNDLKRSKPLSIQDGQWIVSQYRPFCKQWLFYSRRLNERVYQMPRIFPEASTKNRVIIVTGAGSQSGVSKFISDSIIDFQTMQNGQCFPRYVYEKIKENHDHEKLWLDTSSPSTDNSDSGYRRRDAITDSSLERFQASYLGEAITKDDIFNYIYGILHSKTYVTRYGANLIKELPRIPLVKTSAGFWGFVTAGRDLANLHTGYETIDPYPVTLTQGDLRLATIDDPTKYFRVTKMSFGKGTKNAGKGSNKDRSIIHYNDNITLTNVPLSAYDYEVNGRPAIDWVMERQRVNTHKASGITNDANDYANETVGDPRYPFDLLCRVIALSLKTNDIVNRLPTLDID